MQEFGPHTPLVEEVIEFVNTGEFFKGLSGLIDDTIIIETDFEKAERYACKQCLKDDYQVWRDLNGLVASKTLGKSYEVPDGQIIHEKVWPIFEDTISTLTQRYRPSVHERLVHKKFGTEIPLSKQILPNDDFLIEHIAGDMLDIARSRAINGKIDNLFEKMFEIYKRGGWPCGWKGNYPKGKMIVYSPQPKENLK